MSVRTLITKIQSKLALILKELLAPTAVSLNMDWPEAYRFMGYKHLNSFKKLWFLPNATLEQKLEIQLKAVACLEKYISFTPKLSQISQWIDANFRLSGMFLSIPEVDSIQKASQVGRRVDQFIKNIPNQYNVSESDIAFIPRPLAIGSLGVFENLENYVKAMGLGLVPRKKLHFLIDSPSKVTNPCYLRYWEQHVTVVRDEEQIKKLAKQEQYLTVPMLGIFKQYGQRSLPMQIALGTVREQWIQEKRTPLLVLTEEDKCRGWEALSSKGVPKGAWFVCFHVREPGWRDQSAEVENVRNARIESYFEAMKSITDAGGWVVRMGDSLSMTPLPSMERVIDYAHSDLKSDWMDVFLCAECRFMVGTSSGVYTVSSAFGVPCVVTNHMPPHNMFALASEDIVLIKACRYKKENRYLTFKEILSPPVGVVIHAYRNMDIEAIDNTSQEIKGAIDEMLARCEGTLEYSQEDENLQADFKSVIKEFSPLYGDRDIEFYGRIGRDFLKNHAQLLSTSTVGC